MTLSDRILFHQIHAAKLVTDALAAVLSLYYLWRRDLSLAIVAATVPPPKLSGDDYYAGEEPTGGGG